MTAIEEKLAHLRDLQEALVVRSGQQGTWVAPHSEELVGTWIPRGTRLGEIVNPERFRFSAVVSQDDVSSLFSGQLQRAEVRLHGQSGRNLKVGSFEIIPFQHERLPSAALGWRGGGEIPVAASDQTGLAAAEPFFLIHAEVVDDPEVAFLHGRSGKIRFSMEPEPLLMQWTRRLRQLLQKRYQI
jgi:putative peptide zinc metalloprotease protein